MQTDPKLDREVAAIGGLSRRELVDAWIEAYGTSPPKGIKRPLLELSAAWNLQARRLGGLSASTRKALLKAHSIRAPADVSKLSPRNSKATAAEIVIQDKEIKRQPLAAGTRLMREWNGRMYVVDVTASGFLFDGKVFRSLSAIARRITGAQWSGPRFFAL
jgi:hypothetical protein